MPNTQQPNTVKEALSPYLVDGLEFEFEELDSAESIKTNYLLVNRNFKKLGIFLSNLVAYVKQLADSIQIGNIVDEVIDKLSNGKGNLVIKPDLGINQSVIIGGYTVTRSDKDIYKITRNKPNWETINLIVSVKEDISGAVLYPTINTKDDYIEIYFIKGMFTNTKVLFI